MNINFAPPIAQSLISEHIKKNHYTNYNLTHLPENVCSNFLPDFLCHEKLVLFQSTFSAHNSSYSRTRQYEKLKELHEKYDILSEQNVSTLNFQPGKHFSKKFHSKILNNEANQQLEIVCFVKENTPLSLDNYINYHFVSEDLISQIDILKNYITTNSYNYQYANYLGSINDKKVYTSFNKNYLPELNLNNLISLDKQYDSNTLPMGNHYCIKNHSGKQKDLFSTSSVDSPLKVSLSVDKKIHDIIKFHNFDFLDSIFTERNITKYPVFHIPAWKSSKTKGTLGWKNATPSFIKKRVGNFVPFLVNANVLTEDLEIEEVYMLVLAVKSKTTLTNELSRFKNTANAFHTFITLYNSFDSLYFSDEDAYIEKQKQAFLSVNPWLKVTPETFIDENILKYKNFCDEHADDKFFNVQSPETISDEIVYQLSAKPKKDYLTEKKLSKLALRLNLFNNNFKEWQQKTLAPLEAKLKLLLTKEISNFKLLITPSPTSATSNLDFNSYSEIFNAHKNLLLTQKNNIEKNIKEKTFTVDEFLFNLKKDKIEIINIVFEDPTTEKTFPIQDFKSSNLFQKLHNDHLKIREVEFLIDKPVPIYVDSKESPKEIKVGGPYCVKVTSNQLQIKIKDSKSFFACPSQGPYIKVHPHSGQTRDFNYSNACLGEASATLYKAFEENCIKRIILSAMTWVASANSNDVWGRTYSHFINYSFFDNEKNLYSPDEINSTEVNEFLSNVTESEFSDQPIVSSETQAALPSWTPTQFNAPVENYNTYYVRSTSNT